MSRRTATPVPLPRAALKRWVNDVIQETFGERDRTGKLAFFCECAEPSCFATVWATPPELEAIRDTDASLLAPGHAFEQRRASSTPTARRAAASRPSPGATSS